MMLEAVAATVLVSLLSLSGAAFLYFKKKTLDAVVFLMVSFATGSLLGAAFLHLLPEAVEGMDAHAVFATALGAMLLFFILEHLIHWHHGHHDHSTHEKPVGYLVILGDAFHNFFDGVAIAAGFTAAPELGITATIAIIMHEIPQELSDFSLLLYAGFAAKKALLFNLLSGLTAVVGALAFFYLSSHVQNMEFYGLAFAAGGFIYIAATDLIPEIHKERGIPKSALQLGAMLAGIAMIWALSSFMHAH